jgi:hypothetical protein
LIVSDFGFLGVILIFATATNPRFFLNLRSKKKSGKI